jgi:hypothetical protein
MGCSRMLVRRAAEEAGGVLGDAMALHQDALSLTDHDAPSDGGNQRRPPLATIRKMSCRCYRPRQVLRWTLASIRIRHRGLRPTHTGTRHHPPRPLEVGRCDVWLCRLSLTLQVTGEGRRPSGQDFLQSLALVRADH